MRRISRITTRQIAIRTCLQSGVGLTDVVVHSYTRERRESKQAGVVPDREARLN